MKYTIKNKKNKKNKTKKNINNYKLIPKNCPIGLESFEKNFGKTIPIKKIKWSNEKKKKEFVKELLTQFSPTNITPENDFYSYINFLWLKNVSLTKQQNYIVQVDDFRLTQDKVYGQLNEIILDYVKSHDDKLSKILKNFYHSVINMNSIKYSKQLAIEAVETVDRLINEKNVWKMLAYYNSNEMISSSAPFVFSMSADNKDSKVFRPYINAHAFELVDLNIYYDDGKEVEYKKKYREAYFKNCKKIFDICLGSNDFDGKDIYDVEVEIFNVLGCQDISTKEEKQYNKVYTDDALKTYNFDWKEFTKELGIKQTPKFFITSSLNYLKCGSDLIIKNWTSKKWRTYWIFILLKRITRLTKDWEKVIFEFYGDYQRGQGGINNSNAVSAALYMSIPFNKFLTQKYVDKYENPQAVKYVKTLCEDLKIVFHRIMMRNSWLSPSTKKYALMKLKHLNFIVGYITNERDDPMLDYNTSLYDNMNKIFEWRHNKMIDLDGKPFIDIPMMDWTQYPVKMIGTQAYIVNASYTPSKNSIFINLGYIQQPFLDMTERGIEYNLAHIGFTICHEMSHGFDDWGSQYDHQGNLHDWWRESDKKKFKEIQKDVIKQYTDFALRDGINYDASIGIGENIADISGMAICNEYLRDFQENNKDLIPICRLSFEVFYTYYAFQQKQKVSKKALTAQLKTNPHPLDKYRCNIPLSRSEVFRALYNIKKSNDMWWHNTNTIW
jgi:predicted metalloendopeptidase